MSHIERVYGLLRLHCVGVPTADEAAKKLRKRGYAFSNQHFREAFRKFSNDNMPKLDLTVTKPAVAASVPEEKKPLAGGRIKAPDEFRQKAQGRRFVVTCAQNNTKVHSGFWKALQRFCEAKGAQLMVARFSYNKNGWQKITKDHVDDGELWYAPEVIPHIQNEQIKLADGLVFCAELDILPTAKDPLQGLENYTGINSAIVPHVKMHMRSYAGLLSGQAQRFAYTTGTCTLRNYIDRRAGQIASYHHVYGAIYVEIDEAGNWFARQINASDDGSFWDLNGFWSANFGGYQPSVNKVVNLGDIHAEKMDEVAFKGAMDFLRTIKPSHVAIHDLVDFEARNHHNKKDPFFLADQHFNGMDKVEANLKHAVVLLDEIERNTDGAKMLLVRSNHDMAFLRWLKECDGRDPANARYYHHMMKVMYEQIEKGNPDFDVYEYALSSAAESMGIEWQKWVHIKEDDSFVVHEIEFGLHGHLGPNGSKGAPKAYRQLGRKLNTGHTHSAGIIDGIWTAGVLAKLRMGYNKGPSSWSHSHILTHENGKRQMITQRGEQWRA